MRHGRGGPATAIAPRTQATVADQPVQTVRPRRSFFDRIFPVQPGMKEPPWTRTIGLIVALTIIWEVLWFVTYYFFPSPTAHNLAATYGVVAKFFPFALALSALGSIPGFYLMRSRIRRANQALEQEQAAQRAMARQRPADTPMSSRARRRHEAKRRGPSARR